MKKASGHDNKVCTTENHGDADGGEESGIQEYRSIEPLPTSVPLKADTPSALLPIVFYGNHRDHFPAHP
ncbi:hypothetical protein EYF80_010938 [Liparis tanakae]|uniref:Uncharacterized protein n=1 Tax=Liparis tanakae TaxID=230148 RepID=A0A4Z2IM15_9TELE|nr:hypothetical protein EYF80_010938 [Liparis tanakae]